MERLRERKAALDRAIAKSRAGLADTQQILKRIDYWLCLDYRPTSFIAHLAFAK
jgi:hypothetical protein